MKKNKFIIGLIMICSILLVVLLFNLKNFVTSNVGKLGASINLSTNNIAIECDSNSIRVGSSTNCVLKGNSIQNIAIYQGKLGSNSNINISNIVKNSVWEIGDNTEEMQFLSSQDLLGTFNIATFTITAVSKGTGSLTVTDIDNENELMFGNLVNDEPISYSLSDITYNITITEDGGGDVTPASDDNTLRSLKVGETSINLNNPTYTVPYDVNTVEITAVANHSKATVTGDGTKTLAAGTNTFPIIVTAENGSKKTYNLVIIKETPEEKSNVNTLNALTVSNVNLVPNFKSNITSYTGIVENDVTSVSVSATRTNNKSSIVSGIGDHTLIVGVNTINVVVRSESGLEKTYSVKITRKEHEDQDEDGNKSSDNSVKDITIENGTFLPKFDPSKNQNYYVIVGDDVTGLVINATTTNNKATFSPSELSFDTSKDIIDMNVIITAENGSKRYIPLTIVRQSYYEAHKDEIDSNTEEQDISCVLELHSDVYQVDNEKLTINAVDKNHSDITIYNNLKSNCGTISVKDEKVTLSYNDENKVYTINRVFIAQTGQKVIRYTIVIIVLIGAIIGLLVYKEKRKKV